MNDKQIKKLLDEYHVPEHIRRHCEQVTKLALLLARKFALAGDNIDENLLMSAGMLHDLVRVVDFREFNPQKLPKASPQDIAFWEQLRNKYKGMHHADAAGMILTELSEAKVGKIIQQHKFVQILQGFDCLEAKILYYADKRVEHDKIVPLTQRLKNGQARNSPETIGSERSRLLNQKAAELEKEIFTRIGEAL